MTDTYKANNFNCIALIALTGVGTAALLGSSAGTTLLLPSMGVMANTAYLVAVVIFGVAVGLEAFTNMGKAINSGWNYISDWWYSTPDEDETKAQ